MSKQTADQCQNYCKCNTQQCGNCDALAHSFFIFCPAFLSETDTKATGESIDKAEYKIDNNTGGPYCCQGSVPFNMTLPKNDYKAERAARALQELSNAAVENGTSEISLEEINAEIEAVRKAN